MIPLLPVVLVGGTSALVYLLGWLLILPHGADEPPQIRSNIPFFGHVINLLVNGSDYFSAIAKKTNEPIFTLAVPRGKMYIVTSPSMASACDRRSNVVSFAPYVVEFANKILAASQHSLKLLSKDLFEADGPVHLRTETLKAMHMALKPGENMDALSRALLEELGAHLVAAASLPEHTDVSLFGWVRQFVSVATTNAVYGRDKNPMRDQAVVDGFWAVDDDFALLNFMSFPDITAPKGSRGRKTFFNAFEKYYSTGGLESASLLIRARHEVNHKHGVSDTDIAHFDLGVCTSLLVNTVPALSWTLWYAFSDQRLLDELRRGIEGVVLQNQTGNLVAVDTHQVIREFPLVESFVKEVLRFQSNNASARYVLEDIRIEDKGHTYLLKKGSFLGTPSAPIHRDSIVWGLDAVNFDPARFLKDQGQRVPVSAYRAFGGGNALCPGRHLAIREISSVLIMMLLQYDMIPAEGEWKVPQTKGHISTSILTPAKEVRVQIRPREGGPRVEWRFS